MMLHFFLFIAQQDFFLQRLFEWINLFINLVKQNQSAYYLTQFMETMQ